ncbi:hypothetical protein [Helicobacter bilis]|nr:hypothetical protein [Helicobacter bilis]MCI7411432.1 hypothetical protein [Helicobacter bilis]MDD7297470.1 hypothetical protein [Helicobacter bilis]MDY4400295.1 hypothetical protein [Helicobacter bilis]
MTSTNNHANLSFCSIKANLSNSAKYSLKSCGLKVSYISDIKMKISLIHF